jgi:xanthine/CO dehydrogenase XdhC/CoxF family maturation factor
VGLRLGGDGPGAIALSIAAEIQTAFNLSHPVTPTQKQIGANDEEAWLCSEGSARRGSW